MKSVYYKSVLKYTAAGVMLGVMLAVNAYLLNRLSGFKGPWFHIFDYSADYIIIVLSPIILGLLSCFVGIRWQQLVIFNEQIKKSLTLEQMLVAMANGQLKLLGKVIAEINEAVIIVSKNGNILWINDGFTRLTDYTQQDVMGKPADELFIQIYGSQKPSFNINDIISKQQPLTLEAVQYKKDGAPYWILTKMQPVCNENSELTHYVIIQTDITTRKAKEIALENEVAERKILEEELKTNKKKLEQAIEIAQMGAWEVDYRSNSSSITRELRTICHLPLNEDVSIEAFFSHIHPDDIGHIQSCIKKALKGETNEIEYRCTIDGNERHMLSNIAPKTDDNGRLTGYVGTLKDITHRKLFELALKKSEEEKAAVLNNAQTAICLHDLNGFILDVNPATEQLSGFTKAELTGKNLQELMSPDFEEQFKAYLDTIASAKKANGSFQIIRKDGVKRAWLYQNALYDNKGGKPYVIANAIDITETVRAQNEIEKQQQFITQIIENSPNIIFVINEQGQVVLHNKTFSNYYLCDGNKSLNADKLRRSEEDVFLGDLNNMLELEDKEMIRLEGQMPGNDCTGNTECWFNVIKKCFTDNKGRKYILCIGMDITGRYQIETDLIAANEMVERSLKIKDQFISNMSHEIRTPLNAVIGFTDLLHETSLNKDQGEYVTIIKSASQNLLGLVNNILDLSKIESGSLSLENLPIDIKDVVTEAVKILEPKARSKGIYLKTVIGSNLPARVLGDQLRLSQIFFNLVGNAIKFTDVGYVEISCKPVAGSDDSKQYIAFVVRDTGIGVAPEKQVAIFERFTQANVDTERLYGGTGLGLNIAKGIVDMYGGSLRMESTPGKGTAFHFILPFNKYDGPENETLNNTEERNKKNWLPEGKKVHVLLAEDNAINAMLAKQVLENGGFMVTHVLNGAEALAAVQQSAFDVILMDIQMPVMNGITATEQIKQLDSAASKIPVVAMTAHSLYGEMQNCYNAGMTGYVSKPFRPEVLFSVIMESIEIQKTNKKMSNTINDMVIYNS